MTAAAPPGRSAPDTTGRSLAPDLARGLMLLLIAVAHAPLFVAAWDLGPRPLNAAAEFARTLVAENQARAMFILLFGYGAGQLTRSRLARGGDRTSVRRLLRRRGLWLLAIGFAHAVLLVPLDIIAVYGLALVLLAPLVQARERVLWWTAALAFPAATALITWQTAMAQTMAASGSPMTMAQVMAPDYGAHLLAALPAWPVETAAATVVVVPGMLLGVLAARRGILDRPERHAALLRRVAVVGIGAAVVGRLPLALLTVGVWTTGSAPVLWAVAAAHTLTGYLGGVGLAAAVGLLAIGIGSARGRLTTALAALGRRSMTFYLLQSVVWLVLFYPFTLGLGDDMGAAAAFGIAVACWTASVAAADRMHRTGHRGPAEVLLRRLTAEPRAHPGSPPTDGGPPAR